jgi:hypothetical protein
MFFMMYNIMVQSSSLLVRRLDRPSLVRCDNVHVEQSGICVYKIECRRSKQAIKGVGFFGVHASSADCYCC